jgi:hypothetical protein
MIYKKTRLSRGRMICPQSTDRGRDEIGVVYLPLVGAQTAILYVILTRAKGGGHVPPPHPHQPGLIFPS